MAINDQPNADAGNGGVRQRSRASIERRILEAAESVFAEAGFNGATTAEIARRAAIPKANLHYYFNTKEELYQQVLTGIVGTWLHTADEITADADPARALSHYITAKIELAREQPIPSRVFANEIIHGAPTLGEALDASLYDWAKMKEAKIRQWVDDKRILPVEPSSLLYMIWASTQHYADFDHQVNILNDHQPLSDMQFEKAVQTVTSVILRGIGLEP